MKNPCLTCGTPITPANGGWGPEGTSGNNPWPINDDPTLAEREVCNDCNAIYVIPARLGQSVSGSLYGTDGRKIGEFGSVPTGGAA